MVGSLEGTLQKFYKNLSGKCVIMTIKMAALYLKMNLKIRKFLGHSLSKIKLIDEKFGSDLLDMHPNYVCQFNLLK